MTNTSLAESVALITGGASGIGLATGRALLAAGARIVLFDLPEQINPELLYQELGCTDREALFVCGNVQVETDAEGAVNQALSHFGRLDILFNNAGIDPRIGMLHEIVIADWDQVIDTNLRSAFLFAKYCIPVFIAAQNGVIVNNASVMAWRSLPGAVAYSASKAGLMGFTRALAVELAPYGIRVNCLAPGPVETPLMWSGVPDTELARVKEEVIASQPMGRIGLPEEVANVVVFLASSGASYISGSTIVVDGAGSVVSNIPQ